MHHVAIMKKSWGLIPKILSGEKTIESRWYKNKVTPWGKITKGDMVWFKNTGEEITARATVSHVLQFEDLTPRLVTTIYSKYGIAIGVPKDKHAKWAKDKIVNKKRYCILMFLTKPRKVSPFDIDKTGFGNAAAWLQVEHIGMLKLH